MVESNGPSKLDSILSRSAVLFRCELGFQLDNPSLNSICSEIAKSYKLNDRVLSIGEIQNFRGMEALNVKHKLILGPESSLAAIGRWSLRRDGEARQGGLY